MERPLASSSGSPPQALPFPGTQASGLASRSQAAEANQTAESGKAQRTDSFALQDQQTLLQLPSRGNAGRRWSSSSIATGDRLYVTLLRMIGNTEDASDLVQETFVRAMQGVARFEGKSTLYTWLFRIAINLAISHRRSNQYRAAVSLDGDGEEEDGVNTQAAGLRRQLA